MNRVNFIAGNYINAGGSVISEAGKDDVTQAEFVLRGNEEYIRVECIDVYGRTAWSNPIFLKGLI